MEMYLNLTKNLLNAQETLFYLSVRMSLSIMLHY